MKKMDKEHPVPRMPYITFTNEWKEWNDGFVDNGIHIVNVTVYRWGFILMIVGLGIQVNIRHI